MMCFLRDPQDMSYFIYNRGASGYTNAVFQLIFFHISL